MIKTLAIETSCDDTSLGIVTFDDDFFWVENIIAYSQISEHNFYGGVVPGVASRIHNEKIIWLLEKIWKDKIKDVDFISVTARPGLPWSLLVWISCAYMLWKFFEKPVVEVDHISWHIFSILVERNLNDIEFPAVVLTASWGHNDIYVLNKLSDKFDIQKIWFSIDDASWECFDKVARMLWGPYPWGAWISENALKWKPNDLVKINRIFLKSSEYKFSFSWMKSKIYYMLKEFEKTWVNLDENLINDICFEFQEAVVEMLSNKIIKAADEFKAKSIFVAWWVSSNDRLFEYINYSLNKKDIETNVYRPIKKLYSTDNSAMIWVSGILSYLKMLDNVK